MGNKSFVFRFADVEVREHEFSLLKAGKVLAVEPKAFRVLLHLLRNPQKLISKDELLNSVWGDTAVTEGSLTRSIWLLRPAGRRRQRAAFHRNRGHGRIPARVQG
jgi:eukaryotic-like serine/threonine-protein kinase